MALRLRCLQLQRIDLLTHPDEPLHRISVVYAVPCNPIVIPWSVMSYPSCWAGLQVSRCVWFHVEVQCLGCLPILADETIRKARHSTSKWTPTHEKPSMRSLKQFVLKPPQLIVHIIVPRGLARSPELVGNVLLDDLPVLELLDPVLLILHLLVLLEVFNVLRVR